MFLTSHQSSIRKETTAPSCNSSMMVFCKEDEKRAMKDLEEQTRIDRIKKVRNQEKEAQKQTLTSHKQKLEQEKMKEMEAQRYQEYLAKKEEIERLMQLKEIEIERAGKAQRDAVEQEERTVRLLKVI